MTDEKRAEMQRQIEQITCLIKSIYAGMAHDIKIVWRYGGGKDALGRAGPSDNVLDHWRNEYGKHEEVTIGVGDCYYGSQSISAMLYETAYHMRERLTDKLDAPQDATFVDLVEPSR